MTDELSLKALALLKKVQKTEKTSHRLREADADAAKELVENGHCFYSMDYDHLIAYRH